MKQIGTFECAKHYGSTYEVTRGPEKKLYAENGCLYFKHDGEYMSIGCLGWFGHKMTRVKLFKDPIDNIE